MFVAEAFVGPPIPIEDHPWLLVRHRDFTMTFAGQSVRFETEGDFYGQARTLAEWRELARVDAALAPSPAALVSALEDAPVELHPGAIERARK